MTSRDALLRSAAQPSKLERNPWGTAPMPSFLSRWDSVEAANGCPGRWETPDWGSRPFWSGPGPGFPASVPTTGRGARGPSSFAQPESSRGVRQGPFHSIGPDGPHRSVPRSTPGTRRPAWTPPPHSTPTRSGARRGSPSRAGRDDAGFRVAAPTLGPGPHRRDYPAGGPARWPTS